jgi:hypothetical protein
VPVVVGRGNIDIDMGRGRCGGKGGGGGGGGGSSLTAFIFGGFLDTIRGESWALAWLLARSGGGTCCLSAAVLNVLEV